MMTPLQKGKNYFYQISLAMLVAMISIVGCKKDEPTPLAIATFTPAFGSVGDVITINGSGFATDLSKNIVKLGSLTAIVTYAVENSLQFTIPAGAVTGKVSVTTNGVTTVSATDFVVKDRIYVVGSIYKNNKWIAGYWRNDVFVNLTDGTKDAFAEAIAVVGNDVYVAGIEGDFSSTLVAKYWKNGVVTTLTTQNARVTGIAVAGNDVYVAGYEISLTTKFVAKYWKNSIATILSDGTVDEYTGNIVVNGNDIYVLSQTNNGKSKYWKNGSLVTVATGNSSGGYYSSSIAVAGNDVCIGGNYYDNTTGSGTNAAYWKNGVITKLSRGNITSLTVADGIIHSTGTEGMSPNIAKYWRNEVSSILGGTSTLSSSARAITVAGSDIYIAGAAETGGFGTNTTGGIYSIYTAKYWKNGIGINLNSGVGVDNAGATGIVVAP